MPRLVATYREHWNPKVTGWLKEFGEMTIGFRDEHCPEGDVVLTFRTNTEDAPSHFHYTSMSVYYDAIPTMRELDARGFLSRFEKIKAETFYDVLQCLAVAGIPLVSHDNDDEMLNRKMYELLHDQEVTS